MFLPSCPGITVVLQRWAATEMFFVYSVFSMKRWKATEDTSTRSWGKTCLSVGFASGWAGEFWKVQTYVCLQVLCGRRSHPPCHKGAGDPSFH